MLLTKKLVMTKCVIFIVLCIIMSVLAKNNSSAAGIIYEFDGDDNITDIYTFRYVIPNKFHREEIADLDEDGNLILDGVYSNIGPDGKLKLVAYHSDKNGFETYDIDSYEDNYRFCPPHIVASCLG